MEVPLISLTRILPKLDEAPPREDELDPEENSVLRAVIEFRKQLFQRIKGSGAKQIKEEEVPATPQHAQRRKSVLVSFGLEPRDVIENWQRYGDDWVIPGPPAQVQPQA